VGFPLDYGISGTLSLFVGIVFAVSFVAFVAVRYASYHRISLKDCKNMA
jgi:hypothetical protein